MIHLDAHIAAALASGLEREAIEAALEPLATLFDVAAPRDRVALCVASSNAGSATSVRFWADARRVGLALANPALFPWCLANAACGALARRFGVTGPNFTYLGEADALLSAIESAADQLEQRCVDVAIIVVAEFATGGQDAGLLFAFRLSLRPEGFAIQAEPTTRAASSESLRACVADFAGVLRRLDERSLSAGALTDGCRTFRIQAAAG